MRRLATAVSLTALGAAAVLAVGGCGSHPTVVTKKDGAGGGTAGDRDPWQSAAARLRRDVDMGAIREVLGQLTSDIGRRPEVAPPADFTARAVADLAAVPLPPADLDLARRPTFTGLDAYYLADAFYLRDAARSLDPYGLPPDRQAGLAFDWVCRQVALDPWVSPVAGSRNLRVNPPAPPVHVLQRGGGSGLERAYVVLALAQQIGLDACLLGPAGAGDKPTLFDPTNSPTRPPKGPFWGVGVRAGKDVLAFDPWRGEPFPGPGGKGVATLAQLRADPNLVKPWLDEKGRPWNLTADDLKTGTVYLAPPLGGVSPRMRYLGERVRADTGLVLGVDPAAARKRFEEAGEKPVAWNPPDDGFAYTTVLAAFLPADDGGRDTTPATSGRLVDRYRLEQVPREVFAAPPEVTDTSTRTRLLATAATLYEQAFLNPPTPRERTQRGQFNDAARSLVDLQDKFVRGLERVRTEKNAAAVKDWAAEAAAVYGAKNTAQLDNDPAALRAADARIEGFWKSQSGTAQLLLDRMVAEAGMTEATYLLAACKHEVAERQQARMERAAEGERAAVAADAKAAWQVANTSWQAALGRGGPAARADQAKRLSDRAAKMAGP